MNQMIFHPRSHAKVMDLNHGPPTHSSPKICGFFTLIVRMAVKNGLEFSSSKPARSPRLIRRGERRTYSYKARGVTEVKTIGSQAAREGSVGNLCCTTKCLKVRLLTRRMHGHVKYTCPQQYVHIYSYIYTHVRHKRRSRRLLRNNESHRRKPCKKKIKN